MTWLRETAVVDFETLPAGRRPLTYPPPPVGVAIRYDNIKKYLCFNSPLGQNNCTWEEARNELGRLSNSGRPILFHNAGFDVDVWEYCMDLEPPDPMQVHDTMPMLFLLNPRSENLNSKTTPSGCSICRFPSHDL